MRPRLIIKAKLYNILQFYSNKHFVKTNGLFYCLKNVISR